MDIVQVYLNLNNRLTVAQEKEKIKIGYEKLLNLPLKPKPDVIDIQKERYEKYIQPLYDDIDDYQLEITQQLLDYKDKQTVLKQSDCYEELRDWKKSMYIAIEKIGDELIGGVTKVNDEFKEIKEAIDNKTKIVSTKQKGLGALQKRIAYITRKFKLKTNKVDKMVNSYLERISMMRAILVLDELKLKEDEEYCNRAFNYRKMARATRSDWVKAKIMEYDEELERINMKKDVKRKKTKKKKVIKKKTVKSKTKSKGKKKKTKENAINNNDAITNLVLMNKQKEIDNKELKDKYEQLISNYKEQEREKEESNKKWYEEVKKVLTQKANAIEI